GILRLLHLGQLGLGTAHRTPTANGLCRILDTCSRYLNLTTSVQLKERCPQHSSANPYVRGGGPSRPRPCREEPATASARRSLRNGGSQIAVEPVARELRHVF